MGRSHFRRASWVGAIVAVVCAFGCAAIVVEAAQQQQNPPPGQQAPATAPANQAPATLAPITSPEIDALAEKVAAEIASRNLHRVAVFGALGPGDVRTELALPIGDAFAAALARNAQGFEVIGRDSLREIINKQALAEKMLASNILASWISSLAQADGLVMVRIEDLVNSKASVAAYLYDSHRNQGVALSGLKAEMPVDAAQAEIIRKAIRWSPSTVTSPVENEPAYPGIAVAGKNGVANPKCDRCPRPPITPEARQAKDFHDGKVWMRVIVTAEGRVTDMDVVEGAGYGLDLNAVETVRDWRFKPAKDATGKAIPVVVVVEVQFVIFNGK